MRQHACALAVAVCLSAMGCGELRFGSNDPPSGETGVPTDDDDSGGDADCCDAHSGPQCDNPILSACVCDAEPSCCEVEWTEHCVQQVDALGCGVCGAPGSCCEAREEPGCEVPALQTCVCDVDPACCDDAWDPQCVADVFLFGCGMCPGTASCCVADGTPGCADPDVQQCVCAENPSCCAEAWDFQCVQAVESMGCGTCAAPDSTGQGSAESSG
ncbi:MAG: hypothetical protein ACRBN8_03040 [Nannocystales bacterium]